MKKYILVNYFKDNNPKRKDEYLYCLKKNLELNFIDKIIVFLENEEHETDIEDNEKLVFVNIGRRLEFDDAIQYAKEHLENSIIIIINLDIFLENSDEWRYIDEDFFNVGYPNKAMICCRHNLKEDGTTYIETNSWERGEFCDVWVFKTPFVSLFTKENLKFCVGNAPQCDNLMMYLMNKHYHVYSWGEKYKIYHYDICRKKDGKQFMIMNNSTDKRPGRRRTEHARISAMQNWEEYLNTETKPKVQQAYEPPPPMVWVEPKLELEHELDNKIKNRLLRERALRTK